MKLPPAALTAPSLCPRCDSPAMYDDRCTSCGLQLRQCGACQGVVGPFDRYCGFCGHFLAEGPARSAVWRLWVLVAMVPLVAGIAFGVSPLSRPFGASFEKAVIRPLSGVPEPSANPTPAGGRSLRSQNLKVEYTVPGDWQGYDFTLSQTTKLNYVLVTRLVADTSGFGTAKGDLLQMKPSGPVMSLGDPGPPPAGADASDPGSILAAQVTAFTLQPPSGYTKAEVVKPSTPVTADSRQGREAVLRLTRADGAVLYFERAYISGPSGLFKIDALVPQADWDAGDSRKVEAVVQSVRLTG